MINRDFFRITRFPSHEVNIGDRPMGALHPIRLQSMTNTNTLDVAASVAQSIRIIEAGADYVRLSAPNIKAAEALKEIKQGIRSAGFSNPLIADIHFNAQVALAAARFVEKVRINPGNYTGNAGAGKTEFSSYETEQEKEYIYKKLKPLVQVCKEYGTAIRIGTNLGSLSPRIITQYGNTPLGMVNATYEFLEIFRDLNFDNLVISLKASKPLIMIQAYEGMVEKLLENNMNYPLHIGITEAGEGENGRIKSALGICSLLNKGIGDTLRVSLTEDPEHEIPFAIKLSSLYQIPFTKKQVGNNFVLTKSDFSQKEILITPEKYKAIVIGEKINQEPPDRIKPVPLEAERVPANSVKADFYYTTDINLPTLEPEIQFLAPLENWTKNPAPNSIPVIEFSKGTIPELPESISTFFIRICCNDYIRQHEIFEDRRLQGIIADMNQCSGEVNLAGLIYFSQTNQIPLIIRKSFQTADSNELISHFAIFAGNCLLEKKLHGIWIDDPAIHDDITDISFGFLQSSGLRITKTEFISCPTCARTSYNLQKVLKEVQQFASDIPGLKIAVMGCIVNGPGEMADADFGFVGTGIGKLHLYKGQKPVKKNIDPSDATHALSEILKENGYKLEG